MSPRPNPPARSGADPVDPRSRGAAPPGGRARPIRGLAALGSSLILLWVGCWVISFRQDRLIIGTDTWVPMLPMIAGDFLVHIDHIARLQAAGIDPYHKFDDWVCFMYPYPPMIARCFAWVAWFRPGTAAFLWQGALGLIVAAGGLAVVRTRRELGLGWPPRPLLVAALLFSTPVVFAVERGQSDPMIIPPLIAVAWLLRRGDGRSEVLAGALLGLTAWLKYYPGLAVVAFLALGRKRGLAAFVGVVALVGIVDRDGVRESIRHGRQIHAAANAVARPVHDATHSIIENWPHVRFVRRSPVLRQVPPPVAAALLLLPAIALVGRRVAASPRRDALLLPYLLWLAAAATFGLPYSNDYNLTPLPIAALAVWDRRDRRAVHLAILASVLWSQPFRLPIGGEALLGLKLLALYGVGASLAARASRPADIPPAPPYRNHLDRRRVPAATAARRPEAAG